MFDKIKLDKEKKEKFSKLADIIKNYESAVIAFSGGIDSSLLAYLAHHILAQKSLIVMVNSEFVTNQELSEAEKLAKNFNYNYQVININLLDSTQIKVNDSQRCRYCKELIFHEFIKIAKNKDFKYVLDGSNIDDLKDYRPGFEALKQLNIKSPFIEAGFNKNDIRELAKQLQLPNWNKPALACLASRIPYEIEISKEILDKIEKSEMYLKKLGYGNFRVRHHDKIARIELDTNNIEDFIIQHKDKVNSKFKEFGYNYICLDLDGYRTGSLNESLNNKA